MKRNCLFASNPSKPGIALACLLAVAGSAHAAVTITKNNPDIYSTAALTGFATTGGMMGGMSVTVTYSDASTQTATWTTSGSSGSAVATGFTLAQSGDTFGADWTLTNLSSSLAITAFSINARPGNTVFDTASTVPDAEGTPGSAQGLTFAFTGSSSTRDASVTYSDALKLNSMSTPIEDLFLQMKVELDAGSYLAASGPTAPSFLTFEQDTDNVRDPGDIVLVPEPSASLATALLLGAGLGIRRRRQ
jgi:hypothetical protein